ncbi:MAG: metallophosphoesterase family protein [Novosphingobium sp.]
MLDAIRQIFRPKPKPTRPHPAIPGGQRIYAIGDIHGRKDLFDQLLQAIEDDDRSRDKAETTIILLGDLIDRGPDSSGVIAAARDLQTRRSTRIIAGNHEEMFLDSLENVDTLRHFLRFGGRETVLSYPVDRALFDTLTVEQTQAAMRKAVPAADIEFLQGLEDRITIGDYLFVHAGIRPGIPLQEQDLRDLRWIREPFLSHGEEHGWCVVHGHTITDAPEVRHNRIGIDTGAYMSGRLTALGLEETGRWLIETGHTGGTAIHDIRENA